MVGMMVKKQSSHWWWFDSQNKSTPTRSPWLQSTLSELDHTTEAMLKLIEADADSFTQRAEMYYKKRPELISMVEELYRSHRSLAEKYGQAKADSGTRALTMLCSPFSATKYQLEKSATGTTFQTYDCYSEICDGDEYAEWEVDDPELEDTEECFTPVQESPKEARISSSVGLESELRNLKEEIERLEEENRVQREQLKQKDEEKREAIRHLSLAVDLLKEENVKQRKCVAEETSKKKPPFELNKFKEGLFGKLFNGSPQKYPVVALDMDRGTKKYLEQRIY